MKSVKNIIYFIFFISIIIYTILINLYPPEYLRHFDNKTLLFSIIVVITAVCIFDPIIAILLAIALVLTIEKTIKIKEGFSDYELDIPDFEKVNTIKI